MLTVRAINGCSADTLTLDLAGSGYAQTGGDLFSDGEQIGRVNGGAGTALRLSLASMFERHAARLIDRICYTNAGPGTPYSRIFLLTTSVPGRTATTVRRHAVNSAWLPMLAEQVAAALGDLAARGEAAIDRSGRLRPVAPASPVEPTDTSALLAAVELVLAFADTGKQVPAGSKAAPRLSPRQLEVLGLVASGCSNKHIALALGVSPATIKTHVATAIATIGARNRTDAAIRARERGWI